MLHSAAGRLDLDSGLLAERRRNPELQRYCKPGIHIEVANGKFGRVATIMNFAERTAAYDISVPESSRSVILPIVSFVRLNGPSLSSLLHLYTE